MVINEQVNAAYYGQGNFVEEFMEAATGEI
jgi:hypothetical protein